jgi:hypothetical protein
MNEITTLRKNKITLSDYYHHRDIVNRLLMSEFSTLDLEVLEEILYSSLKISIYKLAQNIDVEASDIMPSLEKFARTGLLSIEGDEIQVDKEMRKYYESQIVKFDDNFTPGMDFLQGLLRKVPIHVLPTWYSIPRASNNIFESLVEKYLLTPQIFQRYLLELNFNDASLSGIVHAVYNSPDFKVSSKDLIEKFQFTREQFEEYMLLLEFNFVCCLGYNKVGNLWEEVVTPFQEWKECLTFLHDTEVLSIQTVSQIKRNQPRDFAFILELTALLSATKKSPINVGQTTPEQQYLIAKLRQLKLADIVEGQLYALEAANDWLEMRVENRALFIYRHPTSKFLSVELPTHLCTERNVREAEKSVLRVLHNGWVYYDEFIKGVLVALSESSTILLKRVGKSWRYSLAEYTPEEYSLIRATIFEWLTETGIISTGVHEGRDCFCVTQFGQSLFSR